MKIYENRIRYGHIPCNIDWTEPGAFYHVPPGFGGMPLIRVWENRILDLPEGSPLGNIRVPEGVRGENAERFRNAVLIAPAAFTNKGIPDSFWEKLAVALRKEGFDVYCNSGGLSYDKIIVGTTEYVSSTKELIVNAPLFRHVIGVRSGFTDIVAKTGARMSVLHLGAPDDAVSRVEYGTRYDDVRDLGRMEGIFPVIRVPEKDEEVINLLLEDVLQNG